MRYQVLDEDQREHFLNNGFVQIPGCFTRETAQEYTSAIWTRLGYDPDDQSTWAESSIHMPSLHTFDVRSFAPKAWQAACELVGGEDRIKLPATWGDGFIVNLYEGADRPWDDASPAAPGWHKDGDFFRHFLDSPEQGLLTLVLWSDVRHQGGATFVATDSVGHVARFLAEHPEGLQPGAFSEARLIDRCSGFAEATGEVGTVFLLHPYILHAKAQNVTRTPRYITNPPIQLTEPMRFDRDRFDDHSLVEQAVLRALDTERYAFRPTHEREAIVPARVRAQQLRKEQETQRLAAAEG